MEVTRKQEKRDNNENLPPEILMEICSRLPIKDVFKYQCVAKSWNAIPPFIYPKMLKQPVCGLILRDTSYILRSVGDSRIAYLPKGATQSISIRTDISINKPLSVSSGFDTGYLRDTTFEFGPLFSLPETEFFTIDNGLILTSHKDGTYHVFNPLTKQVVHLPKSPLVKRIGVSRLQGQCAFLINPCSFQYNTFFSFLVMRVIPRARSAEIFFSKSWKWFGYELVTDAADVDEVLNSSWCGETFAYLGKTRTLFLLTDYDQGLALTFDEKMVKGKERRRACVSKLPLPQVVIRRFGKTRLGRDQECVYLSYYDNFGGAWFWKYNGQRPMYNDMWVLVLEIGRTPKLVESLKDDHYGLFKLMKQNNSIIPIGFYPRFAKVFLRVKSTIFTYHLINKKLEKFAEVRNQHFDSSIIVLPYIPFVAPFNFFGKSGILKPRAFKYDE